MTDNKSKPTVYILSDSVGETAELVAKAAASQYNGNKVEVRRIPYVNDEDTIRETVAEARENGGIIVYTIITPSLRELVRKLARRANVPQADIMGPVMDAFAKIMPEEPKMEPGLVRKLDSQYFRRVEAIEFAVKYDDGKDPRGLALADLVLVGVSRTSKTPLSMYLANKMIKVANVPLVPEVQPPDELFDIGRDKVVGLTISPDQLYIIRKERLLALGLRHQSSYASLDRILKELEFSEGIMKKLGCPVFDVTNKAVEETAGRLLELIRRRRNEE
ncbi:MAG: pyruvate, water dikinase regulatory protein [Bacillota bacterium]|jgi:regulator of PEP synthase PpsR (kinase-PPPase family)|nr:kinase/pyrophosphorylase [Bacillota bacterium]HOC06370.1 pyruvate, water dikinase regulatory protein [Bacillota bacterium]HPZ21785.1 pyruvate, water dikinase regulatory protein [Bacillota bacterium]HQD19169.1 pyruvate, water dikinase regulatory protein [Bacillota bacterium]